MKTMTKRLAEEDSQYCERWFKKQYKHANTKKVSNEKHEFY